MGTNFHWKVPGVEVRRDPITLPTGDEIELREPFDDMDPKIHIGKRSAAGLYCWDCRVTLAEGGESMIHSGRIGTLDACPKCGKTPDPARETMRGPVAVELGFAKPEVAAPRGIGGAASFSWAQNPERVRRICEERLDETLIQDEYGRDMTCREFLNMLAANCPIEFTRSIGVWFS